MTPVQASNRLVAMCAKTGSSVSISSPVKVECRKRMDGMEAAMTQVIIGNSYSTTPELVLDFLIVQEGRNARVYLQAYAETIMPFGQPRRVPYTSNKAFNDGMKLLEVMGAEPTPAAN